MGEITPSRVFATLLILAVTAGLARPAEYYVDRTHPRAADSNPGSEGSPWMSIQKAAMVMQSGDTCLIKAGTYDERVQVTSSGRPGGFVTFKALGQVIVRGFSLESCSYVRIIGFEVTQTAFHLYPAIQMIGTDHCQILDNNIHHTSTIGIFLRKAAPSHYNLIRGNRMSFIGSVPGQEIGEIAILVAGNHNLVEYNDISHVADFTNVWGERNIIRNNYFHDNSLSDFPDFLTKNPQGHHIDGLQYYSDAVAPLSRTLMENNLIVNNDVPHAHIVLMRNVLRHPSSEFLFRGNVASRNGAIAILIEAFPELRVVHNTFVDMLSLQKPKARYCFQIGQGSTGTKILNNIIDNSARPDGMTFAVDATSQSGFRADGNLVFRSGSPAQRHGVQKDPMLVSPIDLDYRLRERSPAVDAGSSLTSTTAPGTGTSIPVQDAGYLSDGWDITTGDLIRVGKSRPVRITHVDYTKNVIEVDQALTWSTDDPLHFDYIGKAPDIGALEYGEEPGEWDIRIVSPATGSSAEASVAVHAEAPDTSLVRFVVFHVDGVPVAQLDQSPWLFTWDTSGYGPGIHEIEARAYIRNAGQAPTRNARIAVTLK